MFLWQAIYIACGIRIATIAVFLSGDVRFTHNPKVWAHLTLGSFIFALAFTAALAGNKKVDAAQLGVLKNLSSPVTVMLATMFLNEGLDRKQILGITLIILATIAVALTTSKRGSFTFTKHSLSSVGVPNW